MRECVCVCVGFVPCIMPECVRFVQCVMPECVYRCACTLCVHGAAFSIVPPVNVMLNNTLAPSAITCSM
jgi:hypothetical protein